MRLRFAGWAWAFLAVVGAGTAQAEPIPQDVLDADRQSCNAACARQGTAKAWCGPYCDCNVHRLSERVSREDYAALLDAVANKKELPAATLGNFAEIREYCAAQTDKGMK